MKKMKEEVIRAFEEYYGRSDAPIRVYFAPGRVNIIGEHQDYNGGHVFPAALQMGIYGAYRVRDDKLWRFYSENTGTSVDVERTSPLRYDSRWGWANYPIGMAEYMSAEEQKLPGMDVYFSGNLPTGAGLSSSACILDLTGFMLSDAASESHRRLTNVLPGKGEALTIDEDSVSAASRTKLAEAAQYVEYHFVGVKVGIMDQFAIAHGKKGCGILLNCLDMTFDAVPLSFGDYELLIMDTMKRRGLLDSSFNTRKEECDAALEAVNIRRRRDGKPEVQALASISEKEVNEIEDAVLRRRARHVVTENARVLRFVSAMREGDIFGAATCIDESHCSLRDDYEVSGYELDTIVETAKRREGCIAARMTGAGFGGCAIALVERDKIESFKHGLREGYRGITGITPSIYDAKTGDGVYEM